MYTLPHGHPSGRKAETLPLAETVTPQDPELDEVIPELEDAPEPHGADTEDSETEE